MTRYDPNYYLDAANDAEMIQHAVDAAAADGVRVTVPRRNLRTGQDIWIIPQAILLHSGSVVALDNCHLRQADGCFDNLFRNANARTERAQTRAGRQYDIRICGVGHAVLDGGNHNGLIERNSGQDGRPHIIVNTMLHFHNCERVTLENLNILHPRWWGITFHYCAQGRVSNIRFMSIGSAPNADGVDLRTGCNGFVIENLSGYTQDDSVALTCLDHGFDATMRVEGMDDSIHNVIVRNITTASMCAQVRLLNQDGKKLYNVLVENVQSACELDPADPKAAEYEYLAPFSKDYALESRTTWAAEEPYWARFEGDRRGGAGVRIGQDHYYKDNDPKNRARLGDTFNITVRNVQTSAFEGITIGGTLRDALIENVQTFGRSAIPVYFGAGEYDCIRLRDIGSAWNTSPRDEDLAEGTLERYGDMYGYAVPAAVYFHRAAVRGLTVDGVRANAYARAVFAGDGCDVRLRAWNVQTRGEETKLAEGEGLRVELRD